MGNEIIEELKCEYCGNDKSLLRIEENHAIWILCKKCYKENF